MAPSARIARSRVRPAISAARNGPQAAISPVSGLFCGGTQRTALVMRARRRTQAVIGAGLVLALGKAEFPQCRVEQPAGMIAGERPPGPVGAAQTRRQPDDQQLRGFIAEGRHRRVVPFRVGSPLRRAKAGEPWAERAIPRR